MPVPSQAQTSTPPALPLHDLAEKIFVFLDDDNAALRACALTNRTLRVPSQFQLFRTVEIHRSKVTKLVPDATTPDALCHVSKSKVNAALDSFISAIINAPHLHSYPRSLSIVGLDAECSSSASDRSDDDDDNDEDDGWGGPDTPEPYTIDAIFSQLLPRLHRLHTLTISGKFAFSSNFIYWTDPSVRGNRRSSLLPTNTVLKRLSLEAVITTNTGAGSQSPPKVPLGLFAAFPNLSALRLEGVSFDGGAGVQDCMLEEIYCDVEGEWAVARGLEEHRYMIFSPMLYMPTEEGRALRDAVPCAELGYVVAQQQQHTVSGDDDDKANTHHRLRVKLESLKLRLTDRAFLFFVAWLLLSPACTYSLDRVKNLDISFGLGSFWFNSESGMGIMGGITVSSLLRRFLLATRALLLRAQSTLQTFSWEARGLYLGDRFVYEAFEDVFPKMTELTSVNLHAELFGESLLAFDPDETVIASELERDVKVYFRLHNRVFLAPNLRHLASYLELAEADVVVVTPSPCSEGGLQHSMNAVAAARRQAEELAEKTMNLGTLKAALRYLPAQTQLDFRVAFCGGDEVLCSEQAGLVKDVIYEGIAEVVPKNKVRVEVS